MFLRVIGALMIGSCYALLVKEVDDTERRLQILEQDNALMRQEIREIQNLDNSYQTQISELQGKIDLLQKRDQSVAFFAYLRKEMVNPQNGVTIAFDDVITNVGSHYDPSHGIFRAPVNGTYHFSLVASSPPQTAIHELHLFMKKDDVVVSYIYLDNGEAFWDQQSVTALLHLRTNDHVWVEIGDRVGPATLQGVAGIHIHTHFSGFLVTAD